MLEINLAGRTAVVTGGAGQLGRTIARTLGRCGADVAVHFHVNRAKADEVVADLVGMGRKAVAVQADVSDEASVMAMRDAVVAALGHPGIIVNNAVAQYPWKDILSQPVADFESQFDTCVLHNVLMAKAFVPGMIKGRWGRVVGINTDCAPRVWPGEAAYVAGKRGMDGVLRILAKEVGEHQITMNQVAPGWTISDRAREEGSERQPDYEAKIPLRRRGTDQDIANAVAFLSSDLAGFITGVFLPVSGGTVMPAI